MPLSAWVPHRALVRRRRNDGPGHGPGELDALISAVTVPAHPRELAGERAALEAFRVAQQLAARRTVVPDRSAGRPTRSVAALVARSLTAKLAFGIVVLSLSGVGYAAQTGALPAAAQDAAHRWLGAVGVPESDHGTSPDQPGTGQVTVPATPTPTPSGIPSTPPTADPNGRSLVVLCQDYDDGAALTAPELRRLGKAAGGADRIETYCADALAQGEDEDAQGAPPTPPTPPPTPTTLPTPPTPPTPPTSPPGGGPGSGQGQGQGQGQGPNGNGNAYGYGESQGGGPPASPPEEIKAAKVDKKLDTADDVVTEIDTEPSQPTTTAPTTTTVPTTTPS